MLSSTPFSPSLALSPSQVRFAPEAMRQLAAVFREDREGDGEGDGEGVESGGAGAAAVAAEGAAGGARAGESRGGPGRFSASLAGALALISQVLRQDVRGVRQGRGGELSERGSVGGSVGVGGDGTIISSASSTTTSSSSSSSSSSSYFVHLDGLRVCFLPSAAGPLVTQVQTVWP